MKSALLTTVLTCLTGPALALSCLPPNVATTYAEVAASDKSYAVVHGTLSFDQSKLPEVDLKNQDQIPPHVDIKAQLSGKSLSKAGFEAKFDRPITLRAVCFGPWCGQPVSGEEYLSFLEQTDDGYILSVTPCGDNDFVDPTPEMLDKVTQCFKGDVCTP